MEWVVLLVLAFVWRSHASRIKKLEQERLYQENLIRELTRRVFLLERGAPVVEATPVPELKLAAEPPPPTPAAEPTPATEPTPAESDPAPAPGFSQAARPVAPWATAVAKLRGQDWEAIVGGSWLNAIGVLLVVLGVSLLFGFGVTQFGPAGKIALGVLAATLMLGGGIWAEKQERYRILGRGLLAGGWATLYFTAYASHAVPAARVIDSPLAGGIALLTVACGMIAHSLRYQSQRLTLLAFFSAFAALQLQPLSGLGVAATIPLAIALLTISRKLNWTTAPVAGLLLTYWTFAFRFEAGETGPLLGVAALYAYWIAFELYDLLLLKEGRDRGTIGYALFPLNAFMLLGTAMLTLPPSSPIQSSNFLASLGVLFLASTWLRMLWRPTEAPTHPVLALLPQGYQIGTVLAAALFAGAVLKRFPVIRAEIGLLLEGQLFIVAGIRLADRFISRVGQGVFGAALGHLIFVGSEAGGWTNGGHTIGYWVAMAFVMAAMFYANRWLLREGPELTWPAAGLLMAASGGLLQSAWTGAAWMAIGFALLEVYRRTGLAEFRYQGLAAGALATVGCGVFSYHREARQKWEYPGADALAALLAYLAAWRLHIRSDPFRMPFSAAGSLLAAWALWLALPAPVVTVAWGLLALALLELGARHPSLGWQGLRWQGHALAYCAFARTFIANFPAYGESGGISHRLLTVIPLIALAWHGWFRMRGLQLAKHEWPAARGYSYAAVLLIAALARFELGRTMAVVGWAALMVTLYYFGRQRDIRDFRLQAYALAAATFARSWATNFASADGSLNLAARLFIAAVVIAALHACQFFTPRPQPKQRWGFALMGVALLSLLIFYEASGQALTLCWGAQAALTLAAGFPTRERVLRLAGLALFALCVLKLFFYDLRNLETMARILSFIVMGLVFIAASWLYMRFREKIQRYL